MRLAACVGFLLVLFPGCSESPDGVGQAGEGPAPDGQQTTQPGGPVPPAAVQDVDLSWEGDLPYGVWACSAAAMACHALPDDDAYGVYNDVDGLNGTIAGGNLTLAWTATTQLTERLAIGAVAFVPGCDTCNVTPLREDLVGPSPLVFEIPPGAILEAGTRLRIWVYSADYHVVGADAAGTSGEQGFVVEGAVTLAQQPPDGSEGS